MRARQLLAAVLAVVAGAAAVGAVAAWYVRDEVVERRAFADRAAGALERPAVRRAVREQLTARVVAQVPAAGVVRGQLVQTVDAIVETRRFRRAFRRAAAQVGDALFRADGDDAVLRIDVGDLLAAADPRLASALPAGLPTGVVRLRAEHRGLGTRRAAELVDALALALPVIAACALGLALLASARRWRTSAWAGVAAVASGALLLAGLAVGRAAAFTRIGGSGALTADQARAAADAVVAAYLDDLRPRLWIAMAAGAAVALGGILADRRRAAG